MEKPPLYLFSGLGADERMFQKLRFAHPQPKYVKWIPAHQGEDLTNYAQRLLTQIEPSLQPPVLLGVSFGGIVAQEVAKLIPVTKVIALSSLVSAQDLPWYYRLGGTLKLQKWLPFRLLGNWEAPANWVFGAKTEEEKRLLHTVIKETDIAYLRWALQQILNWKQTSPAPNTILLHGDRDKILPVPSHPATIIVKGGEHLMLLSRANEVSMLLKRII